jgi:hypothetical protein
MLFIAVKFGAQACYDTLIPQWNVCWFYQDDNDGGSRFLCNAGFFTP